MAEPNPLPPRVGVGVIVQRDGRVLLGRRKGSHGAGTWALPGGHLEFGESVEDCARRETEEETGLRLRHCTPGPFTNDVMRAEGKHYVTVFVIAEAEPGEVELREPEKCDHWGWFEWRAMPQPLFQPLQSLVHRGLMPAAAEAPGGQRAPRDDGMGRGEALGHRLSVGALVEDAGRLLLVHSVKPGAYDFWVAPGGGVRGDEGLEQAVVREVREETGLQVAVGPLRYVEDLVSPERRIVKFWFSAHVVAGAIDTSHAEARAEHITEAGWWTLDELQGRSVFPELLRDRYAADRAAGFPSVVRLPLRVMTVGS